MPCTGNCQSAQSSCLHRLDAGKVPVQGRPNSRAISESADKPQTLLRDRGIADGQSFFSLLAWENWSSPKAVAVVMSARVRTSLLPPLSPSVQGRTEVRVIEPLLTCAAGLLHGWIVRWPMAHLCRNPQAVGRGSARLFRKGRGMYGQPLLAVLGMILTMQR